MIDVIFIVCVCMIYILFLGWVYCNSDIRQDNNISNESIDNPITPVHQAII